MNAQRTGAGRAVALLGVCLASTVWAQSSTPKITSVRTERTNLVVTVTVPEGVRRVTLETSDRAGRLSWAPRAVVRPAGQAAEVTFRLPLSRPLELIRVRADATEPLPAEFFQGTNHFSSPTDAMAYQMYDATAGPGGGVTPDGSVRDVVESDIWQIRGNTLYFFNRYRGLQVIDITDPDVAFVRGTVELPAAGDQLYALGNDRIVLLARDGCSYDQSKVLVVADTNGTPQIAAELPVEGTITESRLVGTALYVASQASRPVAGTTNTMWEWGTVVSGFDLSDPDAPVARNTLWFAGYGNVVSATDTYLFVVTQAPVSWWQSVVNLIDITDPAATISAWGAITNRGQVLDKFKMSYTGEVFAAISEDRQQNSSGQLVTRLETFRLPDPRATDPRGAVKLGELELGHGERLHATRFDGNRVYVVTFFQIDPLWVVDFSQPSAPRIAGSVEVPGWSTFIQPLGDRLVTLGIETNHVSVSLYDVSDPAAPARLSQVRLGTNYSWSEANYDEKAFTVLPGAGLVLVPFSGDTTNGYTSALQLIDYSRSALRARGQILSSSGLSYRRATVIKDRVVSISDWELVSADATDRDNPGISGRLQLAESVDRVILAGDFLIRLSTGNGWDIVTPVVSVASTAMPDHTFTRSELPPLPLLGATKRAQRLYLAQGTPGSGSPGSISNDSTFVLTVFSLTNLPSLPLVSQSITNTGSLGWSRDWQALWPEPGVLVWAGGQDFWWWCDFCPVVIGGGPLVGPGLAWGPYWRATGGNGRLIAFDAREPDSPQLASQLDLTGTNRWGFSKAFTAEGLVYLSHQTSEFVPDPGRTNSGAWVYRSFLDVVDMAEPGDPLVREPVSLPNPLTGVSDSGALVFSVGAHWGSDPNASWLDYLDACAYDGVAAHLVDSIPLSAAWPHPVLVLDTHVMVGNPGDNNPTNAISPMLESWALSDTGKFFRSGWLRVGTPLSELGAFSDLVAANDIGSNLNLFEAANPSDLQPVGRGSSPLCWWWPDLGHSDGSLGAGLWVPLGAYGMTHIPIQP